MSDVPIELIVAKATPTIKSSWPALVIDDANGKGACMDTINYLIFAALM